MSPTDETKKEEEIMPLDRIIIEQAIFEDSMRNKGHLSKYARIHESFFHTDKPEEDESLL